jgi:hypothetical protein
MSRISTRHLDPLPDVDGLKSLLQSLAVLDAIMSPEWESRYYSFNSKWSRDEQMGSMRNGCGDEFFALFNRAGCFLKGFAHEYPMSPYRTSPPEIWPGVLVGVPAELSTGLSEPAFSMADTTFCFWRRYTDDSWSHGPIDFPDDDDPDGSEFLLAMLDGDPDTYRNFAEEYFERTVALDAIRRIYSHRPLTDAVVRALNADTSIKALRADIQEIGYPAAGAV